jgi:glucose-1-phosphate cytidylyltransferase
MHISTILLIVFVYLYGRPKIMKCVILAGGLGSRLSEETSLCPKPMVGIGGKPILWHIMKIYAHHGIHEFIICIGYKGYVIKEYFANYFLHLADVTFNLADNSMEIHQSQAEDWKVTLVDSGQETMTGGRLRRVAPYVGDGAFCFTYGDGVSDVDISALIEFHKSHGKLATVTGVQPPGRFGQLIVEEDSVMEFCEKSDNLSNLINGGFFVLEPGVIDYIAEDSTSWELSPLEKLSADNQLACFRHGGYWKPMDTLRDRRELESLWSNGKAPWKVWK